MAVTARIMARRGLHGPELQDLLTHIAQQPGELALLHDQQRQSASVLACEPVLTIEISAAGRPRWIAASDLPAPAGPLSDDPLEAFQEMLDAVFLDAGSLPLPLVGWLGQISYDIGRFIERLPTTARDDLEWPLLRWTLFDGYFIFDPEADNWTIATLEYSHLRQESAEARLDRFERLLAVTEPADEVAMASEAARLTARQERTEYCQRVGKVKEYIAAGDIYQANLAQRWDIETPDSPLDIYRRLQAATPASYAAFLRWGDRAAISASPELFLERRGNNLKTRPIKGTRRRIDDDAAADQAQGDALLASAKDQAELAMIVDLLRNDLGRVCRFGSVQVVDPRKLEAHATVWHTTATIEGVLDARLAGPGAWAALLRALCPGGSITGVPKIRAMEIIDELEPVRRGLYCGHLGVIGPRESGVLNIAIRTILMKGRQAFVYAGGGIVADSDPEQEYEETCDKARGLWRALGILNQIKV